MLLRLRTALASLGLRNSLNCPYGITIIFLIQTSGQTENNQSASHTREGREELLSSKSFVDVATFQVKTF